METPQERYDRIERWVGAYRTLMKSGLYETVHQAGVPQYLDDDGLPPRLTIDDVEHLLLIAQHLAEPVPSDLVQLYAAHIARIPQERVQMFGINSHMVSTIRDVRNEAKAKGMAYANLRVHRQAWDAAVSSLGTEG